MRARTAFAALALVLAHGAATAADQCKDLADLAAAVAEHKEAGIPQAAVASQLRAQYREDSGLAREQNAVVERMLPLVYEAKGAPDSVRRAIERKCREGEFKARSKEQGGR